MDQINTIPTSDDIFADLYRKYIFNEELYKRAENRDIFKIDNEEYIISELKNMHVTFTNIETYKDVVMRIDELEGVKETNYRLIFED